MAKRLFEKQAIVTKKYHDSEWKRASILKRNIARSSGAGFGPGYIPNAKDSRST